MRRSPPTTVPHRACPAAVAARRWLLVAALAGLLGGCHLPAGEAQPAPPLVARGTAPGSSELPEPFPAGTEHWAGLGTPPTEDLPPPELRPVAAVAPRAVRDVLRAAATRERPTEPTALKPPPTSTVDTTSKPGPPERDELVLPPASAAVAPEPRPVPPAPAVQPAGLVARAAQPGPSRVVTAEPPIRLSDLPRELPPLAEPPPAAVPRPPASKLPASVPLPGIPAAPLPAPAPVPVPDPVAPGPIEVDGTPLPFESLSQLVDGGLGGPLAGGCATCGGPCGDGQCRAGRKPCEPFPARTCLGRAIGLVYENICCPDPCYKPRWDPITAAAFFVDAPRPVTQTRVRWDYGHRLTFPDRGEFFWPRADGNGKGPKPNPPALGVPYLDYHELSLDQEIATAGGLGSVTISQPYRSVNPTPWAESAAGFGDLRITAKSLLFDSELFLFAFQMRTYIPTGNFRKGLGTGHLSLEPGLIAGVRVAPDTYAVAQVEEWIPIGGDSDYMGAALRYHFSFNQVLWRPVKDVQLIGTWELTGISFQDGLFTEPTLGPQKLSGQTALSMGFGARLFFCDKFDLGAGVAHGITGKYLMRDHLRVEFRYRY